MQHKRYYDKELKKPKKVLLHTLEYFKANNYVEYRQDSPVAFFDSDEALLNAEGVSSVNFVMKKYIGKAFDIKLITDDGIRIPTGKYSYVEIKLWAVDRVLNYEDDPEYYI